MARSSAAPPAPVEPARVELPRLRPEPWPITPLGPYRLAPGGGSKLVKFPTKGLRVIRWIESHCCFTDDRWAGKPFRLLPWQKQLILDMFEQVWDEELGRWRRRYRTVYVGVPKKQGKTELAAAISCWFLFGSGEPSPNIIAAASAEDQADLVFNAACAMVEGTERFAPLRDLAEVWAKEITLPGQRNARIRKIAANGGKFDGKRLLLGVCDELHEWQTPNQRKMYGMIRGAFATREEPMQLIITTAGEDTGDEDEDAVAPWLSLYRYGRKLEAGEVQDDAFMFRWWMAPADCNHRDRSIWASPSVNPSFGVTVREAFYADEVSKRTESDFRRYYLNQPQETLNIWLEHGTWEACRSQQPFELQKGVRTYLGWDASTKRDSTAVVVAQWVEGRLRVKPRVWERPILPGNVPDPNWKVPRNEVVEYVTGIYEQYDVVAGGYDPAFISWIAEDLEARGLALFEFPQNDTRMVPATQALYEMIIDKQLEHDGDPVLTRHIKAAKVKRVGRGGERLVKSETGRKIDAAIALVMAVGMATGPDPRPAPKPKPRVFTGE